MAATGLADTQTITVSRSSGLVGSLANFTMLAAEETESLFDIVAVTTAVAKAMWNPGKVNELDPVTTLPNVITTIRIAPKPYVPSQTLPVPADKLQFAAPGVTTFSWGAVAPPTQPVYCNEPACTPQQVIEAEMAALRNPAVLDRRAAIVRNLAAAGVPITLGVDTSLMATLADQMFLAAPVLVPLGGLTANV
jgi:hypothetical protein